MDVILVRCCYSFISRAEASFILTEPASNIMYHRFQITNEMTLQVHNFNNDCEEEVANSFWSPGRSNPRRRKASLVASKNGLRRHADAVWMG